MEPTAKQVTISGAPEGSYQHNLLEAMEHAFACFFDAYQECEQCGLVDSEVQSRGLLIALNKLLGVHLAKHLACMQIAAPNIDMEIECIVSNIRSEFEERFPILFTEILKERSQKETKQ